MAPVENVRRVERESDGACGHLFIDNGRFDFNQCVVLIRAQHFYLRGQTPGRPVRCVERSIVLSLFIMCTGLLYKQFDFFWVPFRWNATINDTDLQRHGLESILSQGNLLFG